MYRDKQTSTFPLNPGWILIITLVAGLIASGPIAGSTICKCGYRKTGRIIGIILGVLGLGLLILIVMWNVEWYWSALTLSGVHLLSGLGLLFILKKAHLNFKQNHELTSSTSPLDFNQEPRTKNQELKTKGTYRSIITGIAGGAFICFLFGMVCTTFYLFLIDRLFSTFIPVLFEDSFALVRLNIIIFFLMLSGAIAGGFIGKFKPQLTIKQMVFYLLALLWAYFTWMVAQEIMIAIPGFQAGAATNQGWRALTTPLIFSNLLIGFWWPVFLLYYIASGQSNFEKLKHLVQVIGINLLAGITLSITLGYPADAFLGLGRYFERTADPTKALWCYEHGLRKKPKDLVSSYLQFRVALLNHKLGNQTKAIQGFRRVVAKYTSNGELVRKANQFLDNLDRSAGKKRVILPGVETKTEYKGGYCVPNSLALAMHFWGSNITARKIGERITGLGSGTFVVNQTWFAEQEGFRHDFLPMASLEDVKQCINAGFPVLVYVPAHIFAIVGYDEALETFITYDVATRDVWVEYLQKDFIKAWKKQATTLVLAYPPEKENLIPMDVRKRLTRLSNNYLHFQLHFFDAPSNSVSLPHLVKAAGDTGEFFFPLTILYSDFPATRKTISHKYNKKVINKAIMNYFGDDFDEGIHLWGQYHDERWASPDWALNYSIEYLIGQGELDLVAQLVNRINEKGQVSDDILAVTGMIDLAKGKIKTGLDQLLSVPKKNLSLYTGLVNLKIGDNQGAIRELVKTLKGTGYKLGYLSDLTGQLDLDEYGFPDVSVANNVLIKMKVYDESKEELEKNWEEWIHSIPFDAPVAEALLSLYEQRIKNLNKTKDAAMYQRLERKIKLLKNRIFRYSPSSLGSQIAGEQK
ncbi:MAG: C39 family peptidase [bacterium]